MSYRALATVTSPRKIRIGDAFFRLGDDIWSTLFDAGKELTHKGVSYAQEQQAKEQATKTSAASLETVLAADRAATEALATALVSAAAGTPSAAADDLAARQAQAAQDAAAYGLSPDNQKKRSDAAKEYLDKAIKLWQAATSSKNTAAIKAAELRVKAAQTTYAKTQNQALIQSGQPGGTPLVQTGSWLSRPALGPIPGWGVLLGGGILALGVGIPIVVKLVRG